MIKYQVKRLGRSRSIRMRIESNGEVAVTAPKYVPSFIIDRFVKANEDWIQRHRTKTTLVKTTFPVFEWEQKLVSYLGKLYKIAVHPRGEKRLHLGGELLTLVPITGLESDAKKMLVSWLKREGEREITERTKNWALKMKTSYASIQFRQQKSRWGSCTRDNRLSFNWRLIHFKPEVIDYVVIHELSHTLNHDHSRNFWGRVAEYDPGYKQKIKFLSMQGLEMIG